MINLIRFVGLRSLLSRPMRTTLTTLSILFGIALYISITLINQSTLRYFSESFEAVFGKATLLVTGGEAGFSEGLAEKLEKIPGVSSAVPVVESKAWLANADVKPTDSSTPRAFSAKEAIVILGVDLLQEKNIRSYQATGKKIIGDSMTFITQADSIIVTEQFAEAQHLKLDDQITLKTIKGNVKFTVRGMLAPTGLARAYGGGMAIMDIDAARIQFGKEGKTDRIDIVTKDGVSIDEVADNIRKVAGSGVIVERPELQTEQMERMLKSFQVMLKFFGTMALLVSIFLIANSITISIAERRAEIGSLRALGATRFSILCMFIFEGLTMGLVGSFIGAFVGRIMAGQMVESVSLALTKQGETRISVSEIYFGPKDVWLAVVIGLSTAILASIWPSIKATLIKPIDAMKKMEEESTSRKGGFFRYSGFAGLALFLYGVAVLVLLPNEKNVILDISSQIATMLGAALIGPACVHGLLVTIRQAFGKKLPIVTRLAIDNVLKNPRRAAANVMTLMVGLMLVIILSSVNRSFKNTILTWYARILHADLVVSSNGKLSADEQQQMHEDVVDTLKSIPEIDSVYALRYVRFPFEGRSVGLKAIDELPKNKLGYDYFDIQDRPVIDAVTDFYAQKTLSVLVSTNFTKHFQKKTGDTIELTTPTGMVQAKIVGVLIDYMSAVGVVYIPREVYKKIFQDPVISAVGVQKKENVTVAQVRAVIADHFGEDRPVTTVSNEDIRADVSNTIDRSFAYTKLVEVVALLVAMFGLMNTMLISIIERMREFGMMRAIGLSGRSLRQMILTESATLGVLGASVAVVVGTFAASLWVTQGLANALGWIIQFSFPKEGVLLTLAAGIIVSVAAAFYPSLKASRIQIADAIDYE